MDMDMMDIDMKDNILCSSQKFGKSNSSVSNNAHTFAGELANRRDLQVQNLLKSENMDAMRERFEAKGYKAKHMDMSLFVNTVRKRTVLSVDSA